MLRDLIPWSRGRDVTVRRGEEANPFLALHREMNRLFDDVFRGFEGLPGFAGLTGRGVTWPSLEVSETDKEIRISAELPGLEEKDVEVLLGDGVLTLRGEKKSESEDKERHFSERYYGRFERRIALPAEVEADQVQASFRNGVLSVTLPKSAKAQEHVKRIPVNGKAGK